MATKKDVMIVIRLKDFATTSFRRAGIAAEGFKKKIFNIKAAVTGMIAAFGAKKIASSLFDVSKEVEKYNLQLETATKSAKEAKKAFDWAENFARVTPFDTGPVVQAYATLKTVGIKNAEEVMRAIGDTAMATQNNIRDVTAGFISGETDVWRRMGIEIDRSSKVWTVKIGDFVIKTKSNMEDLRRGILEAMEKGFAGGMERAGKSVTGAIAEMRSLWWELKKDIMGASGEDGPFAAIRDAILVIRDDWAGWAQSTDYKKFVKEAQKVIVQFVSGTLDALSKLVSAMDKIYSYVANHPDLAVGGIIGYMLWGKAGAVAFGALGSLVDSAVNIQKDLDEWLSSKGLKGDTEGAIDPFDPDQVYGSFAGPNKRSKVTKDTEKDVSLLSSLATELGKAAEIVKNSYKIAQVEHEDMLKYRSQHGTLSPGPGGDGRKPVISTGSGNSKPPAAKPSGKDDKPVYSDTVRKLAGAQGISLSEAQEKITAAQEAGQRVAQTLQDWGIRNDKLKRDYSDLGSLANSTLGGIDTKTKEVNIESSLWVHDLSSGLADAIVNCESLGDALKNVLKQLASSTLQNLFSGMFGGKSKAGKSGGLLALFGMHSGGVVGKDYSFIRNVPRMHSGGIVGSDEQLTILQKGETVIPKGGGSGGGNVQVNVYNQSGVPMKARSESSVDGVRTVVSLWLEGYMNNVEGIRGGFK